MMVGHATLAFALAGVGAVLLGVPRERALAIGVAAGVFAVVPDVDMLSAPVGVLDANLASPEDAGRAFWGASTETHRGLTHSIVVAVPAAVAVTAWSVRGRHRWLARGAGSALGIAIVAIAAATGGGLAGVVTASFVLAGGVAALVVGTQTDLRAPTVLAAALVGFLSHPWGDLVTGQPPPMLAPLDVQLLADRVPLHPDPTLHLLGAFGLELVAIWAGLLAFGWLTGRELRGAVDAKAGLGVLYAPAVVFIPAPTLELSYPFVFSIVGVGAVFSVPPLARPLFGFRELSVDRAAAALATGLVAVSLAWLAYGAGYLLT